MKKVMCVFTFILTMGCVELFYNDIPLLQEFCYAAEVEQDIPVNAKSEVLVEGAIEGVRVNDEEIKVEMDDGTVITAQGEFEESIRLMVMPIKKSMKKEWNWLQDVMKRIGVNKSAYDIFFVNSAGVRVDGCQGSQISVMSRDRLKDIHVYFIDSEGEQSKLKSKIEEYVVKFKMVRNGYYTLVIANEKQMDLSKDNDSIKDITQKDDTSSEDKSSDGKSDSEEKSDDEDSDDGSGKKVDGSQSSSSKKETDSLDMKYILLIVGVFLVTGIIFKIILLKRKKDEEDKDENEDET